MAALARHHLQLRIVCAIDGLHDLSEANGHVGDPSGGHRSQLHRRMGLSEVHEGTLQVEPRTGSN